MLYSVRAALAAAEFEAADIAVMELEQVAAAIGTTSLRGIGLAAPEQSE